MSSPDTAGFLSGFLWSIRGTLVPIKATCRIGEHRPENIPANVHDWCRRWEPIVDTWISAEEQARLFLDDNSQHDWEQIVLEVAEKMKDVSIAYTESITLTMPESEEGKNIVEMGIHGIESLNRIIGSVRAKDYHLI